MNLLLVSSAFYCSTLTPTAQFGVPEDKIRVYYITLNSVGDPNKEQAQTLQGKVTSTAWLWLASKCHLEPMWKVLAHKDWNNASDGSKEKHI